MDHKLEFSVGVFILLGMFALALLAVRVSGVGFQPLGQTYDVTVQFSNIGTLKPRAPVKIGGVVIGRVSHIKLSADQLVPTVTLSLDAQYNTLPETSSAAILTSGLLGEQYVSISPGFVDEDMGIGFLQDGSVIADTRSALVLEELIGKFLYNRNGL